MLRAGTILGGRYEIISKIGSGGMSDVYKAKDGKLNRFVAIKVLKSEFSSEENFVSKFRNEAQSAACLTHPNIVSVFDVGEDRGVHYIVMELIEGITLKKYIERKKKLEIRESIEVAMQVARGIEAAHNQHIIHRDIKPQNIMISRDGKVKVTDFGIARASSSQTISSNTMGSVHYISPEQARGGYCDERSDIYSLGITLYEMLTGRVPFEGDSTVSVALLHIQGEMVPPRQYEPLIPVSLEKIILKCTQKKPEMRYASATELIGDLKKSLMMPNEDFVKITSLANDSSTVIFNEDDRREINRRRNVNDSDDYMYESSPSRYVEPERYDRQDKYYDRNERHDRYDRRDTDESSYNGPENHTGIERVITAVSVFVAILIVLVVAALAFKGCSDGLSLGLGQLGTTAAETTEAVTTTEVEKVEMRNLLGMTQEQAVQILYGQGLRYRIESGTSDTYNEGEVYEQEYKEGEMLPLGTEVSLKVSTGSETAQIPDNLAGKSVSYVQSALKKAGFDVPDETLEEYSNEVQKGYVINTSPVMGSVVAKGSIVVLVVSKGPEKEEVKVPDITGITEAKAISRLEDANLKEGKITYEENDKVSVGMVISQDVKPGTKVAENSSIAFSVSKGSATTTVPNVVNSTLNEARSALKAAGLEVGSVTEEYSEDTTKGLVISQSEKKGSSVPKGTSISLVISLGKEPEATEPSKKETEAVETKPAETQPQETEPPTEKTEEEKQTTAEEMPTDGNQDGGDPDDIEEVEEAAENSGE